jgi:type II secretory ATPase GspE/PulE/Tfp pilus assembly ATPase PilB-like protein
MVGEIRDEATTRMVMRAAISGHLVFSTIHAPGAIETVVRLLDMEVEPHMIVASLKACLSQRLLRRLCPACRKPREASVADKRLLGLPENRKATVYDEGGCAACHQLGYQGRFAALELLLLSEELRDLILRRDYKQLGEAARSRGFRTLREHAVEKVLAGETSIKELVSCLG